MYTYVTPKDRKGTKNLADNPNHSDRPEAKRRDTPVVINMNAVRRSSSRQKYLIPAFDLTHFLGHTVDKSRGRMAGGPTGLLPFLPGKWRDLRPCMHATCWR